MTVGHGEIKLGDVCVRGCGRPARELGGHCTPCWMALSAAERAHLAWEDDVDRQAAAREVEQLRGLYELDAREPRGRAA